MLNSQSNPSSTSGKYYKHKKMDESLKSYQIIKIEDFFAVLLSPAIDMFKWLYRFHYRLSFGCHQIMATSIKNPNGSTENQTRGSRDWKQVCCHPLKIWDLIRYVLTSDRLKKICSVLAILVTSRSVNILSSSLCIFVLNHSRNIKNVLLTASI